MKIAINNNNNKQRNIINLQNYSLPKHHFINLQN